MQVLRASAKVSIHSMIPASTQSQLNQLQNDPTVVKQHRMTSGKALVKTNNFYPTCTMQSVYKFSKLAIFSIIPA